MIKPFNFKEKDILVIFGATASGKNNVALEYAKKYNGIIINADSAQVYKQCPSLTNIPEDKADIEHYLYQFLNINDKFSVVQWLYLVKDIIDYAFENNKLPIVVGGTGMYISALLNGLSPIPYNDKNQEVAIKKYQELGQERFFQLVQDIDPDFTSNFKDPQRLIRAYEVYLTTKLKFSSLQKLPKKQIINGNFQNLYLYKNRNKLYNTINDRTDVMIANGAICEVQATIASIENAEKYLKKILGATDIFHYLNNQLSLEDTISLIKKKTRHYAKRQLTWFNNQMQDKEILMID